MPENEPELDTFARELLNEVTPGNVVKLNRWLAGVVFVVMGFIIQTWEGGRQDEKRDAAISVNVEKLSTTVGALSTAQIRSDAQLESHRTLQQNDQDNNDRRFMEVITRLDEAIGRIR